MSGTSITAKFSMPLKTTLQSRFKTIYRTELLVKDGDKYWNSECVSEAVYCINSNNR